MANNGCGAREAPSGLAGGRYLQKNITDARSLTYQEKLEFQLADVNRRKAELEEALELLKKNPDIERLLTLMGEI